MAKKWENILFWGRTKIMGILRKKQVGNKKILCVGCIEVPYEIEKNDNDCILKIGNFTIPYSVYEVDEEKYLKVFGISFNINNLFYNRKQEHYKKRNQLSDEVCKQILQKELTDNLGYTPNIDDPKTFNEKILWSKFNDHNPLITKCCDKYAVKNYVSKVIGEQYVLPVLGVWNSPNEIDFNKLPNKFALKVNWSSGYNIIVKDKLKLDFAKTKKKLLKWIQPERNSYYDTFNWGYKNMKPVIYAEPYIEQLDGQLYDYKFFICNGKFEFLFIATDRLDGKLTYTFFDNEFQHIPCRYGHKDNANPLPLKPRHYDEMITLAEKLAKPFNFVRVDFYETDDNKFYVGEMTFYSGGGTLPFEPQEWDYNLGRKIVIEG